MKWVPATVYGPLPPVYWSTTWMKSLCPRSLRKPSGSPQQLVMVHARFGFIYIAWCCMEGTTLPPWYSRSAGKRRPPESGAVVGLRGAVALGELEIAARLVLRPTGVWAGRAWIFWFLASAAAA